MEQFNSAPKNVVRISEIEKKFKDLGLIDEEKDSDEELLKFLKKLKSEDLDEIRKYNKN